MVGDARKIEIILLPSKWQNFFKFDGDFILEKYPQKFCEVFFTKPLHEGFFAAFCHLSEPCRKRRDTPLKTQKIVIPQL